MTLETSFDSYFDNMVNMGIISEEPNSIWGKLIQPAYSQKDLLKSHLSMRFDEVNVDSKKVLDIGAGTGMYSAFVAHMGADRVVALEPEAEGSSTGMIDTLDRVKQRYDIVESMNKTIQEYNPDSKFDIVISNNSINHLDESACIELHKSESARNSYNSIFSDLSDMIAEGGILIIADGARKNFWNDIGVRSPFINLEWEKHQQPQTWSSLLQNHQFREDNIMWESYLSQLGWLGRNLFSNYWLSYLTYSKFILKMVKQQSETNEV